MEEEGKRRNISPQNVLYKNAHAANIQDACTTNWWPFYQLLFATPKLSVCKEDPRETNFPLIAFIGLVIFCLPKLARVVIRPSSSMLIFVSRALGLSVLYLKKGISA